MKFNKASDAQKATEANGKEMDGRQIEVRLASAPRAERKPAEKRPGDGKTVFVGGLSYQSTEKSVKEFFKECGNIVAVRIAEDNDGKPKGFAHVEFEDAEAVPKATALSGKDLDGRNIRIDVAGERSNKTGGGSGRGGFRGRSRGGFRGGNRGSRGGFHDRRPKYE